MLNTRERNALSRAIEANLAAQVERVQYGVYRVPSTSEAGVVYTVRQAERGWTCDCPAGQSGYPCKHKAAVLIRKTEAASGCRVKAPAQPAGQPGTKTERRPRRSPAGQQPARTSTVTLRVNGQTFEGTGATRLQALANAKAA